MSISKAVYGDVTTQFVLSPMELTDTSKNLFTNIIANIQGDEDTINSLATDSQAKFNEVIDTVNTLKAGTDVDLAQLEQTMADIIKLETSNDNTSFVSVFKDMYDELNRREEADTFRAVVTEASGGKFALDLSGFEFASVDDYQIAVKIPTQDNRLITGTFSKVDANGGVITLRNEEVFQDADISTSFYDPAGNSIDVIVLVIRTAVPISGKVTLVDGTEATFGTPVTVYPAPFNMVSGSYKVSASEYYGTTDSVDGAMYGVDGFEGVVSVMDIVLLNDDDLPNIEVACTNDGETNRFTLPFSNAAVKEFNMSGVNTLNGVQQLEPVVDSKITIPFGVLPVPMFLGFKSYSSDTGKYELDFNITTVDSTDASIVINSTTTSHTRYDETVTEDSYGTGVNITVLTKDAGTTASQEWYGGYLASTTTSLPSANIDSDTITNATLTSESGTYTATVTGTCGADSVMAFATVMVSAVMQDGAGTVLSRELVYAECDSAGSYNVSFERPLLTDGNVTITASIDAILTDGSHHASNYSSMTTTDS